MGGILAYGSYIPHRRIERAAIGEALGAPGGKGSRSVASFDEDTTSMGVEAARATLRSAPAVHLDGLSFSTVDPAYLDKTNANAVHAALALDSSVLAFDRVGAVRSAFAALVDALESSDHRTVLVVSSDIRIGLPGGADEREGGDGAAAVLVGPAGESRQVLAEMAGTASATAEFLDRWRVPGEATSKVWEERFGEHAYLPLAQAAFADALKAAEVTARDVDHLIVTGTQSRAVKRFASGSGVRADAVADDLVAEIGNTGAAHPALLLSDVLDRAEPGQLVALVVLSDGADVLLLRTGSAVSDQRPSPAVRDQVDSGRGGLSYADFLTWRGLLRREPPRRPDPDRPAAPPSLRAEGWKFAFEGSRCTECAMRHLPPQRVCVRCHTIDRMEPESFAGSKGTVATYTVDRLAYSPSPPLVAAVIDFDGGGRYRCELTDVDASEVAIGDRVEMTFRRLYTAGGVHDYFWKARPARSGAG